MRDLGKCFSQGSVLWWSSGGEWGKRQVQVFFWRSSSLLSFRQVIELEGPRNRLGTTSYRASALAQRPSTSLALGFEAGVNLSPSLSLWPNSSSCLSGLQSVRTGLPLWVAWGDWGPVGLGVWLSQGWQLAGQDVGIWPWRRCQLGSASP